jgi:hypothetical protein
MPPVDPARIITRAAAALNELQAYPTWRAALDKASVAAVPLLVRSIAPIVEPRAGMPARPPDYYIVSVTRENGVSARFAYDAETSDLLEAEGVKLPGGFLKPYVDPWPIIRSRFPPPSPGAPEVPPATDAVWMPCRQSTNPFAPFYRYHVEGKPLYVRVDGAVYEALTITGRG